MIKIIYKSLTLSIINVIFINLSVIAAANTTNSKSISPVFKTTPDSMSRHKFSLGLELFPYSYKEPNMMKANGVFYGINGSYSFYLGKDYFLRVEARLARGKTNYSSNETGRDSITTPNRILETRILYSKYFQVYPKVEISPFIGFGFRHKQDDSSGQVTTTGHIGYLRKSNYYYVPVGFSMNYDLQKGWGLYISGEYDIFLRGKQESYREYTIKNNQSKGYGLRSEILLDKTFDKYIFSIGPYINYWNIKDSDNYSVLCSNCGNYHYFYEPKNNTKEIGIKTKFTF